MLTREGARGAVAVRCRAVASEGTRGTMRHAANPSRQTKRTDICLVGFIREGTEREETLLPNCNRE
jgi:hypothetical protein